MENNYNGINLLRSNFLYIALNWSNIQSNWYEWPAGERFKPHRHYGGEEIFVLSGEFIDEHGRYPKGTWLRSPHLSEHFPYVEQETIIFVKTGHLIDTN